MKKRISILIILAVFIFAISVLQPAIPAASAETGSAADPASPASIIAEKTDWARLQEGDRFYIVLRAGGTAFSLNQKKTRVDEAKLTVRQTETRRVLTAAGEGAALFEKIDAGSGAFYLKCESGYLTASEDTKSLFYAPQPLTGSRWTMENGESLANADVRYIKQGQPLTVYIEYYPNGRYFTPYAMTDPANLSRRILDFYKAGNSKPGEALLPEEHLYSLPVFETSDLHGALSDTPGGKTRYLLAYISDKVKDVRGYEPDTRKDLAILLDGGDIYQGTTVSGVTNGHALSAAMDLMGYDAVTVGNHEFDWGLDMTIDPDGTMPDYSLRQFAGENKTPVVISNLYLEGKKLSGAQDYVILEKTARDAEGNELPVRVGVIGMADAYGDHILYAKFTGAGYSISVDYEAVNALAAELKAGGQCDAVILLLHGKAAEAAYLLGDHPAIDLVLGGHTHDYENFTSANGLKYMAPSANAGSFAYCEMAFAAENGQPVFREIRGGRIVPAKKASYENSELDPEMVMLTDTAVAAVREVLGAEIGYITENAVRFDYFPESGGHSSAVGNWVCSIMIRMTGADVALINGSGIRTSFTLPEGRDRRVVTLEDVYLLFPFDNQVCVYEITWEEMKQVMEYALTHRGWYMLAEMSGMTCYYTNREVLKMTDGSGNVVYDRGAWADGRKEEKVRVAMPVFVATNEKRDTDTGLSNPFWIWQDTSRRLDISVSQIEGTIRVLTREAAEHDGFLAIDTAPHFVRVDPETAAP